MSKHLKYFTSIIRQLPAKAARRVSEAVSESSTMKALRTPIGRKERKTIAVDTVDRSRVGYGPVRAEAEPRKETVAERSERARRRREAERRAADERRDIKRARSAAEQARREEESASRDDLRRELAKKKEEFRSAGISKHQIEVWAQEMRSARKRRKGR